MVRLAAYVVALAVSVTTFALSISSLLQHSWVTFHTPRGSPIDIRTSYGLFQVCTSSRIPWLPGDEPHRDDVTCRRFPTRSQDCRAGGRGARVAAVEALGGVVSGSGEGTLEAFQKRPRLGKGKGKGKGGDDDDDEDDDGVWGFCDSWITAGYATQLSLIFGATAIMATLTVSLGGRAKRESGWRVVSGLMSLHAVCLIVAMSLVAHEYNVDDRFYSGSKLGKAFIMATTAWALDVVVVGALIAVGAMGLIREDDYRPVPDA